MKPAVPITVVVFVDGITVDVIDPSTWTDGTAVEDPTHLSAALAATAAQAIADAVNAHATQENHHV